MARFHYRMQNILDIKLKLETQAKNDFGIANRKLAEEEEKLKELYRRRQYYEDELKGAVVGSIDFNEIQFCKNSITTIKSMIRTQMMQVHVAQRNVEIARKRLNEVRAERKTHENLKERDFEAFKAEEARAESKAIDELVSYSYHNGSEG